MKNLKRLIILVLFFTFLPFVSVFGWNSHGLTLSYVVSNIDWLKNYNSIIITPYTYKNYETEPINPEFQVKYLEGKVGDKTDAVTILTTYADEPDWGLDENMKLSNLQVLTGGPQGYRHMYYKMGFITVGTAPTQIEFWFHMAEIAKSKGDLYWTFRFLARALHYMEDITQPYHGTPGPTSIILGNIFSGIKGLTIMCSNHHYALEDYQGYMVKIGNPDFVKTLQERFLPINEDKVKSLTDLGKFAASLNRERVKVLWPLETKLFGNDINSKKEKFKLTEDKIKMLDPTIEAEYNQVLLYSLRYFNGFSRLLLEYARKKLGF
ncbi:phospholipase C/P1 nuclease family protein [Caldisericum exile]|uniref:Phospholipase n=1 Tax=Caldisericum exile (strain DSM 21853 / NBRC 104410 / AZM16c01) TaxID=511051 RepID=A0A7U6JFX5_CALEA|nr:hypothetical protein [Caldisericum exile]BAL80720.1 hypothetical protein CSE_05940 [Caldisericum exile AZM16c01]